MSKKQQSSKKKYQANEYTGSGVFSINKARTSVWTKVVLIILALAMVIGTSAGVVSLIIGAGNATSTNTDSLNGNIEAINSSYAAQVKTAQAEVEKSPDNAALYATLGNTYFDWANELQTAVSTAQDLSSVDATATTTQIFNAWTGAADAYKKAIELDPGIEPGVKVDYSFALYYSGDYETSRDVAEGVIKTDPTFSMAWLSLGESYAALNETAKATEAYQKYIELAPADTSNANATQSLEYAKSQIESLKGSSADANK